MEVFPVELMFGAAVHTFGHTYTLAILISQIKTIVTEKCMRLLAISALLQIPHPFVEIMQTTT